MSKCLSLLQAALLCNNSSYVLLRLDFESFIKAGPSRRRWGENSRLRGWSGAPEPKLWGNRWHHGFTWQVYEAAVQLSGAVIPSCLHSLCWSIQCSRIAGLGYFEMIFLFLFFYDILKSDIQKTGRFTSISWTLLNWNYTFRTGSGDHGEEGWSSHGRIFANWHTSLFACLNC